MTPPNGGNKRLKKNQSWIDKNCSETPIFVSDDKSWYLEAVQWSECSVKEHFCFLPPVEAKTFFPNKQNKSKKGSNNLPQKSPPKAKIHISCNDTKQSKNISKNNGPLFARFKPTLVGRIES